MIINFDLVISFDDNNPFLTIEEIKNKVMEKNPEYNIIINYDQDFTLS